MARFFLVLGALNGGLSVALGAFGAHALASRLEPRALEIFETGVRYQSVHALALLAASLLLALAMHARRSPPGISPPAAPGQPSPPPSGAEARQVGSRGPVPGMPGMPAEILLQASGWAFLVGIVLFSGALFLLSLAGIGRMGAVAPLGGLSFIAGWLLLAMGGSRLLAALDTGALASSLSDQG